jgi:hypothetical protein
MLRNIFGGRFLTVTRNRRPIAAVHGKDTLPVHKGFAGFVVLVLGLAGCASSGGTLGGLVPLPKTLQGSIVDNVYIAKDGAFRVTSPHQKGSNEYTYMAVKEKYSPMGDYVSFGPAAFDQSIYRVNFTGTADVQGIAMPFETAAEKVVASFRGELEKGYGTELIEKEKGTTKANGRSVLSWTYVQSLASHTTILGQTAADTLTHEVIAIDGGNSIAVLWVQTPASCGVCEGRAKLFINSFEFAK